MSSQDHFEDPSQPPVRPRPAPRRPRSFWQTQYKDWRASGQNKAAFCAERGLNVFSFDNWCGKLGRAERAVGKRAGTGSRFVPVTVAAPVAAGAVTLSIGDISVRFDSAISAEAVAVWARTLRSATC